MSDPPKTLSAKNFIWVTPSEKQFLKPFMLKSAKRLNPKELLMVKALTTMGIAQSYVAKEYGISRQAVNLIATKDTVFTKDEIALTVEKIKSDALVELQKEWKNFNDCRREIITVAENRLKERVKYDPSISAKDLSAIASDTQKRLKIENLIEPNELEKLDDIQLEQHEQRLIKELKRGTPEDTPGADTAADGE